MSSLFSFPGLLQLYLQLPGPPLFHIQDELIPDDVRCQPLLVHLHPLVAHPGIHVFVRACVCVCVRACVHLVAFFFFFVRFCPFLLAFVSFIFA